jgi:ribosomal-protein-alanine N-acetyltransferase
MWIMEPYKDLRRPNYNIIIKSRSIIIKPLTDDELTKTYISWLNNKETNQYLEVRHEVQTKESVVNYINNLRKRRGLEMFAIFEKKTNVHIGNLTITSYNDNDSGVVDFGLMIGDENSRKRGSGGEVHICFLEFIFSMPNVLRINANVASENKGAIKTLLSVGYIQEGVRRKCFPLENGERCDVVYFGMLKEEWNSRRNNLKMFLKNITIQSE